MAFALHFIAPPWRLSLPILALLVLTGCDQLGIETPGMVAAKKEAEGRAIGSACRHAVRSIEDCHATNPRASKAAIFAGWREMDEYMRENDIPGMPSTPTQTEPPPVAVAPPEEVVLPRTTPGASASAPVAAALAATQVARPGTNTANPPNSPAPVPNSAPQNATAPTGVASGTSGSVQLPSIPGRPNISPSR